MNCIEPHADGALLLIRAHPGARRPGIKGVQNGRLVVAVGAIAEGGKANRAIIELLCDELALRKSQVELVSGTAHRQKKALIRGVSPQDIAGRIERILVGERPDSAAPSGSGGGSS